MRICHWSLAGLVAVNFVEDSGDRFHRLIGYAAVGVVVARLTWAAISRANGSLRNLRPSVDQSLLYLRLLRKGVPPKSPGHNPLGIWMIWLIWSTVVLLGATGWMSRLDAFWGDDTVHLIHSLLADLLLLCVVVHVVAIAGMSFMWRENLAISMIYRRKHPS